ncbi:polysaccharide biosynthesis/export family protein [Sphingomonas sp. ST-64]|uniref:Polysaccharide biosynthesis/export family protein n=1 Tax=Sphingomonas plantiphila TaxID=3163295 RepID=A0ABW8YMC7_9SPHN
MPRPDLRWLLPALLPVSACSTLPAGAPTVSQVVGPASASGIAVVDIADMPPDTQPGTVAPDRSWPIADAAPWSGEIGVGDTLTVTVFEVGYSLFAPSGGSEARDAAVPAANARVLPKMEVGESGEVAIPYLGTLRVAGRSAAAVSSEIGKRLRGMSQSAQVVVSVDRGPARSVVTSGDVRNPGRHPLTLAGERLLDMIAQAGGPANRPADTRVRLVRAGQVAEIRLDRLRVDSAANVRLAPGDHVQLIRSVRSLTVLGSARNVSEVPFESDDLSLAEAIARSGGLVDERADATGVFVFRYEEGVDGAGPRPVIYRLNLLDPRSYFLSQKFRMREKDVLLVANARSVQFGKLVQMLNTLVTPAITIDLLTR